LDANNDNISLGVGIKSAKALLSGDFSDYAAFMAV
jgi:hypothetical protein